MAANQLPWQAVWGGTAPRRMCYSISKSALSLERREKRRKVQRSAPPAPAVSATALRWTTSTTRRSLGVCSRAIAGLEASRPEGPAGSTMRSVVLPTALVMLLCNMDRICMSVAILPIAREMAWAPSVQGLVQSAFLWGYTITQIAGGTLADRYGGRVVIAYAMAWFSLASLLLPAALSKQVVAANLALPAVLLARAAVGFGEGVVLPAMSNLMATRIPTSWRATALGIVYSGFHSGNPAGLCLSPVIMAACGWQGIFHIFGALGFPLLVAWLALVPSQAASAPMPSLSTPPPGASKRRSLDVQPRVSMAGLMSKPATWALIIVNIVNHWGYFIFLSWMPSYFYRVQGLDLRASSLSAFIPWLALATCSPAGGLLADRLLARGVEVVTVRKRLQSVAFLVPAAMLLVLARPDVSPRLAVACMTIALGATSMSQFVANMSDIAPRYAGQLFGLCNTFGCLAAALGIAAVGIIFEVTGSFGAVFKLTAGLYVLAIIAWNLMCSGKIEFV